MFPLSLQKNNISLAPASCSTSLWDILKFVDSSRHVDQEKKEMMKEEFGGMVYLFLAWIF